MILFNNAYIPLIVGACLILIIFIKISKDLLTNYVLPKKRLNKLAKYLQNIDNHLNTVVSKHIDDLLVTCSDVLDSQNDPIWYQDDQGVLQLLQGTALFETFITLLSINNLGLNKNKNELTKILSSIEEQYSSNPSPNDLQILTYNNSTTLLKQDISLISEYQKNIEDFMLKFNKLISDQNKIESEKNK